MEINIDNVRNAVNKQLEEDEHVLEDEEFISQPNIEACKKKEDEFANFKKGITTLATGSSKTIHYNQSISFKNEQIAQKRRILSEKPQKKKLYTCNFCNEQNHSRQTDFNEMIHNLCRDIAI